MEYIDIENKVIAIIRKVLKIEAEVEINSESDLVEDLGADSIDAVEIIFDIEDEFDVTVSGEEIRGSLTVGEICDFLEKLKANEN